MSEVGQLAEKVRAKNAGPFWVTIDIFCGSASALERIGKSVPAARVAAVLKTDEASIKRFEIPDLNVLKFSIPRPVVQGAREDRDMHGAAWAALIAELEV